MHPSMQQTTLVTFRRSLLVVVVFSLAAFSCTSNPRTQGVTPAEKDHVLLQQLEVTGKKLIQVIKESNAEEFVKLCDLEGLELEADGNITFKAIREQMRRKTGLYCLLFDTKCLRREEESARQKAGATPAASTWKSFSDIFASVPNLTIDAGLSYELKEGRLGGIEVKWDGDPSGLTYGNEFPVFGFIYRNGVWRLTDISTY